MTKLFAILTVFLLSTSAMAQNVSGSYYDTDRNGEGIFVIHNQEQERILFSLYTFDPDSETCETIPEVVYQPEEEVLVIRQAYEVCIDTGSTGAWYVGTADWDNGAFGEVYKATAYDYPMSFFKDVAEVEVVGLFVLDAIENNGMRLLIVPHATANAPDTLYGAYEFNKRIFAPVFVDEEE